MQWSKKKQKTNERKKERGVRRRVSKKTKEDEMDEKS